MSEEGGAGNTSGMSSGASVNGNSTETSEVEVTDVPIGMPMSDQEFKNLKRRAQDPSSWSETVGEDEENKSSDAESR